MNEPVRLREGQGPAAVLLRGAELEVPSAARQRALMFASTVAAGVVATSTATAAGATSLAKSFAIYLAIGTVGGGALSLAATQLVAALESPLPAVTTAKPPPARVPPARVESQRAPVVPAPAVAAEPRDDSAASVPVEPPRPVASDAKRAALTTSLFEEQRAIERARVAIARGAAATGLMLLDDYERSYTLRQFGPEALALRIEALQQQGQLAAARARAIEFERRYPRHPLLARVRELSR